MPSPSPVGDRERLLRAHDGELRTSAEFAGADHVERIGPLWLGTFGTRGLVSYADLDSATGDDLDALIAAAVAHYAAVGVDRFEWKTRGHDAPSDLGEHLIAAGFVPAEPETVMIGEIADLAVSAPLPAGVGLRRAGAADLAADVRAVGRLHAAVFAGHDPARDAELLARLSATPAAEELWLVESAGRVVCAGRFSVEGRFAGLFGAATAVEWRRRGLYRALTAARVTAASRRGATHVYAECTEFSRPILERSGLLAVTTTTPYLWHAEAPVESGR